MRTFITKKAIIVLLFVFSLAALGYAQEKEADKEADQGRSAQDVANELANPNTSLGFMLFQLDYIKFDGDLPDANDQDAWRLNFQPSIPYPLGKGVNFFLRPLIPIILDQPVFEVEEDDFESKGVDLGNIGFDVAIGKSFPSGLQLIGGLSGVLPTATDSDLNSKQLLLGPLGFVGWEFKWGFLGALVSHQWNVAGWDDSATSITAGQYFYTINQCCPVKEIKKLDLNPLICYYGFAHNSQITKGDSGHGSF